MSERDPRWNEPPPDPDAALKDQGCPLLASRESSSILVLGKLKKEKKKKLGQGVRIDVLTARCPVEIKMTGHLASQDNSSLNQL